MRETQAPTGGEVRGWQREALPLVAARIPARARVVVECGCGDGSLGALFLRRAPGCRWYGFDRSETALAVAAERLSAVGRESAGSLRPASYGISSADVLLYGAAAVEALSPAALREHLRVLAPRGAVILAVPEAREEAAALQALVRAAGLVPVKTWRAPALLVCQRPEERQPGLMAGRPAAGGWRERIAQGGSYYEHWYLYSDKSPGGPAAARGLSCHGARQPARDAASEGAAPYRRGRCSF